MFAKVFLSLVSASVFATGVMSTPLPQQGNDLAARGGHGHSFSFNNWHGLSSLDNFDSFYGSSDFDNSNFHQVVVQEGSEVVCHSETVTIIQQRLAVLQEMAKQIITEQICDVETQTIVFQQYYSSLGGFSHDLLRSSGHQVGFDSSIVSHFSSFYNSDGSLSSNDFGFHGSDVGSHTIVVSGSNWNSATSPSSVGSAYQTALSASSYYS